ncbi:MAG: hypothetical protein M3R02_28370 [Chloroflexota bacterium]|nr:hypothetical protein [Chloroflexota bacterium]
MPIFSIFALFFFGVLFWAGVVSVILKKLFKRTSRRLLNTISVAVPVIAALPRGVDTEFFVTLLLAVPTWLVLEYADRQERTSTLKKASQATPSTDSD